LEKGLIVEADFQFIQHEHKAKHLALARYNVSGSLFGSELVEQLNINLTK
jgi:hypothetical protein